MDKPSFQIIDCCMNCLYAYMWNQPDDPDVYYCCEGAPPRPKSGAWQTGEEWIDMFSSEDNIDNKMIEYRKQQEDWHNWSVNRVVPYNGICKRHIRRKAQVAKLANA